MSDLLSDTNECQDLQSEMTSLSHLIYKKYRYSSRITNPNDQDGRMPNIPNPTERRKDKDSFNINAHELNMNYSCNYATRSYSFMLFYVVLVVLISTFLFFKVTKTTKNNI